MMMWLSIELWKTIRENMKITAKGSLGYYEFKQYKSWFNEDCSKLSDQRKQTNLQWLQDPSQISGDNLNNVRCEVRRHFRNKKMEYLKDNINELATHIKNKNITDLYSYGLDGLGLIFSIARFFSSPQCPDWLWGPPTNG
jgi:hypothetical protein